MSELSTQLRGRAEWYDNARPGSVKAPGLLREAADALDAAEAQVTRLTEALSERPEWLEDDDLSDAFHAELKRQGAFSMEKHGMIALATAPFQNIIWDALRRAIKVDNEHAANTSTGE